MATDEIIKTAAELRAISQASNSGDTKVLKDIIREAETRALLGFHSARICFGANMPSRNVEHRLLTLGYNVVMNARDGCVELDWSEESENAAKWELRARGAAERIAEHAYQEANAKK